MSRKVCRALCAVGFLVSGLAAGVVAQVKSVPLPTRIEPKSVTILFPSNVAQMDGKAMPKTDGTAPSPSISFKEGERRVFLTADAKFLKASDDTALLNQIELSNFRTVVDGHKVDLVGGSDDKGVTVPPVGPGGRRSYVISWESVQLETQEQAAPVITVAAVGAGAGPEARNKPTLSTILRRSNHEFSVAGNGISPQTLLDKFKAAPGRIRVVYELNATDPEPGTSNNQIEARGHRLMGLPAGGPPTAVVLDVGDEVPRRAASYTAKLQFPAADLRGSELAGFEIPAADEFVVAEIEVNLPPRAAERAETQFFFEGAFTSVVDPKNRKRSNVGLFGLHIKPTIPMLTYNVRERSDSPWWVAFRPLFDADVDTQPIDESEAPNRVVFGMDFELGRETGLGNANNFVQQLVWINGARYDSDRDFKLQTAYWHTELIPYFRNWEQERSQRLRQFRFPSCLNLEDTPANQAAREACKVKQESRKRGFPVISSYSVRPSVGYQLGGTVKRDDRELPFPTSTVSRLFFKYSSSIELIRLFKFSLEDTYYLLENAPRRRHRNYLETRLDLNTGAFITAGLGGLQSALSFKFQRGELPPRFKPVNTFSFGVRLYR